MGTGRDVTTPITSLTWSIFSVYFMQFSLCHAYWAKSVWPPAISPPLIVEPRSCWYLERETSQAPDHPPPAPPPLPPAPFVMNILNYLPSSALIINSVLKSGDSPLKAPANLPPYFSKTAAPQTGPQDNAMCSASFWTVE